jgi:hypothetical protein
MMWIEDGSSRRAKNLSGEVSMILRVKFDNEKYDYVNSQFIDDLIEKGQISMFYRPSEKRWVDIGIGPIRGDSGVFYIGPERRTLCTVSFIQ